jgi:hypothetical protein
LETLDDVPLADPPIPPVPDPVFVEEPPGRLPGPVESEVDDGLEELPMLKLEELDDDELEDDGIECS